MTEFFTALAEWLSGFLPWVVLSDWEQGVRVRAGQIVGDVLTSKNGFRGRGLHFLVPFWDSIESAETNTRVLETDLQTVTTANGQALTFSLAIAYRTRDLRASFLKIHDHEETILGVSRASGGVVASSWDTEGTAAGFGDAVRDELKSRARGWGLDVVSVAPVNFTTSPTLRLLSDSGQGSDDE